MNTVQPFPQPLSDFIDTAFEDIKVFEHKERIRKHLKTDPDALPLIQQIARDKQAIATGVSKKVFDWILAGCPDEN